MGFFDSVSEFIKKLWEGVKPSMWDVFQFALDIVIQLAQEIIDGYMTKEQAREQAVQVVREHFASDNPGLFSENKARLMVELAVAWYKKFGEANSQHVVQYKDEPSYMDWYLSRPDKK